MQHHLDLGHGTSRGRSSSPNERPWYRELNHNRVHLYSRNDKRRMLYAEAMWLKSTERTRKNDVKLELSRVNGDGI